MFALLQTTKKDRLSMSYIDNKNSRTQSGLYVGLS